jgi:hypothetical protein
MLLDLKPAFPIVGFDTATGGSDPELMQLAFWARNFCILPIKNCRFVVLNSSAYHGMGRDNSEFEHGRISPSTLARIKLGLDHDDEARRSNGQSGYLLNVLLCHHHLEKDGLVDDPDRSQMTGAHALVEMMSAADHGRWMVIHGHRHRARLFQAGGTTGPFVLSAASFGATRDKDYDNTSPNQVHLIELDVDAMVHHDFYPAGKIRTWTWQAGMGWLSERYGGGGLPPTTGFGFRGSVDAIARTIAAQVDKLPSKWQDICAIEPKAIFLDYNQLRDLRKVLRSKFGVAVIVGEDGTPIECGRET